jgi:hypothetical protein
MRILGTVPAVLVLLCLSALPAAAIQQVGTDKFLVNDSAEEIEPALISQSRFGVDYVVSVYMKFNPTIATSPSTLQFAAYTSTGLSTYGPLPTSAATAAFTRYADPVLAQQEGVTNPRIYLAAIANNVDGLSGLIIWSSDNGGWSWTAPYLIEALNRQDETIDKPHITIGPDGRVHVAYLNAYVTGAGNLLLHRAGTYNVSTGGWAWTAAHPVLGQRTFAQGPQVMVDSNDDIYILYTEDQPQRICLVRDDGPTAGLAFAQVGDVPNIGMLYGATYASQLPEFIPLRAGVSVRAATVPVARLDRSAHRISVAWHESDRAATGTGPGHARIRFASLETDGARTWTPNPLVIAASGGFDINVGMAADTFGRYLVTYYSFPSNDSYYSQVGTTVYFSGDTPVHDAGNNTMITGNLGDVADYSQTPGGSGQRYLGEYHDVSFSLNTFKSVHVIVTGIGNPRVITATH